MADSLLARDGHCPAGQLTRRQPKVLLGRGGDRLASRQSPDPVKPLHPCQAVRNQDHAASVRHFVQRGEERALGFRIQSGAWFIRNRIGAGDSSARANARRLP